MRPNPQIPADLITFTEEILNGKLYFLCSARIVFKCWKVEVNRSICRKAFSNNMEELSFHNVAVISTNTDLRLILSKNIYPFHFRIYSRNGWNVCKSLYLDLNIEKQPSKGILRKRCSENMKQIYRRTTMPKCDINNVAL